MVILCQYKPLVCVFQLDWRVHGIWSGSELGIHMTDDVISQILQRLVDALAFLVSLENSSPQFAHMLVIGF